MKMKLKKLFLLGLLWVPLSLFSQNNLVTGVVKDAVNNEELIGVTVRVKGTQKGTVTDFEGKFTIDAQQGQILVFSYIGFKEHEVKISSRKSLVVSLSENIEVLGEVVVVGYGVQKKSSAVGSIASTKGEDLLRTGGVNSVSEALQGQMPGVVAISSSAKPGADAAEIFIRGKGTWGSAAPLILVDGIERNFNDLDINEIESISTLKDASATAVYGVKGANGVILVTSKRGKKQKAEVNFSANVGFKQPSSKVDWADYVTSMKMYNEANINDMQWDKLIPESTLAAWENAYATGNYGPYNDYFPEVDWWGETIRKAAVQQRYNLNIRGGTDRMRYFASLGYLSDGDVYKTEKQDDYDPSFNYKRYNWRYNVDFNITKSTLFSANIAGNVGYRNQPVFQIDAGNPNDKNFFEPFLSAPTNVFPIRYSDGQWGDNANGRENLIANMTTGGQVKYKTFQGFYDFTLKQDLDFITEGLSVKGTVSYTSASTTNSKIFNNGIYGATTTSGPKQEIRYYRVYDYANPVTGPDGSVSYPMTFETRFPDNTATEDLPTAVSYDNFDSYSRKLYYEFALNYARSFAGHTITAMGLFLRRMDESTSSSKNSKMEFAAYEEDWVGRITYNWKEIYLLELNGAYTGSEKFAPGKRFGFFPSFSVGWRLSEEPWMKWKHLSNLKFRYSYGKVGNDKNAPRFNYLPLFSTGDNVRFGLNQDVAFGPLYSEGSISNPDATWELTTKQNFGIELGLFHKLNMTLDLFKENRTKILMQRQTIASWSGFPGLPSFNLGETKNHGLEFEISWNDKINKEFTYWAKFNFATSENRIVFRDDPYKLADYLKYAGKPIGVQRKYIASGNYTSIDDIFNGPITNISSATQGALVPGDLFFIDYNGDGIIDTKDQVPMKRLNYPLTTCALSFGLEYKNFGLNALIYGAPDVYKESIGLLLWDFPASNVKAQPETLERWVPERMDASGPVRPSVHLSNNHNKQGSTYSYTDHAYVRLKNVELNYKVPKKFLKRMHISGCQFYVNGNNLLTFTKADPRRDPETANSTVYPIVRRYNVGMRLSF